MTPKRLMMAICSSWARRIISLVLVVAILLGLILLLEEDFNAKIVETHISPTSRPSASTPKPKWVILSGHLNSLTTICDQGMVIFPGWNIAVATDDKKSVYVCGTGVTRSVNDLSYGYPSLELTGMPQLVASLFAIQEGAEVLYLPSNSWMQSNITEHGIKVGKSYTGLISQRHANTFSPAKSELDFFAVRRHFGCIDAEHVDGTQPLYDLCEHEVPGIQAPIAWPRSNGRHQGQSSRSSKDHGHPVCDPRAPPATVPEGIYVDDLQIEGALYSKRAFWALVFPALLKESAVGSSTIPLLKILVQKALWSAGTHVMLWHNGYNHVDTESFNINQMASADFVVMKKLQAVHCVKGKVRSCLTESLSTLSKWHSVSSKLINAISGWFDVLELIDKEPQTLAKKLKHIRRRVTFYPVDYSKQWYGKTLESKVSHVPVTNIKLLKKQFVKICDKSKIPSDIKVNLTHPWEQFSDVLLLVVFNKVHYEVIPLIEGLYRPFFPNILYCGPGLPNSTHTERLHKYKFSFIHYHMTHRINILTGLCNYECAAMAMSFSYNVAGYAIMGDDVLISLPKINKRPRDVAWFIDKTEYGYVDTFRQSSCGNNTCISRVSWPWWGWYRYASEATIKTLKAESASNELYNRCYKRLTTVTGAINPVFTGLSDFYYVPRRLANDFVELAWLFRRFGVFLEIAAPTILSCLEDPDLLEQMPSTYLLTLERDKPWLFYNEDFQSKVIMHPTKWGAVFKGSIPHVLFYCYQVLPYLHDPLARVRELYQE